MERRGVPALAKAVDSRQKRESQFPWGYSPWWVNHPPGKATHPAAHEQNKLVLIFYFFYCVTEVRLLGFIVSSHFRFVFSFPCDLSSYCSCHLPLCLPWHDRLSSGTMSQNKLFHELLWVKVFCHSSREVTDTSLYRWGHWVLEHPHWSHSEDKCLGLPPNWNKYQLSSYIGRNTFLLCLKCATVPSRP